MGGNKWKKVKSLLLRIGFQNLRSKEDEKQTEGLILLLFLFFTMIVIIAYAQSPLSHVKRITVKGNELYTQSEIIKKSGISENTNIWKIRKQDTALKLQGIAEIKKADDKN